MENMYENMQHSVVCMAHVGTLSFTLMAFKPYKYRKPRCVPTEAKRGILITQGPDNRILLQPENLRFILCGTISYTIQTLMYCFQGSTFI